jgi:hypothetical protein
MNGQKLLYAAVAAAAGVAGIFLLVTAGPAIEQKDESRKPPAASAANPSPGLGESAKSRERARQRRSAVSNDARATLVLALDNCRTALSVIANNIANAETDGYKASRVVLEDTAYRHDAFAGTEDPVGHCSPEGRSIGTGSRIAATHIDFSQGRLARTGEELDVAIEGIGFFQVSDQSGSTLYCRTGRLVRDTNGSLAIRSADSCRLLTPKITVPQIIRGHMHGQTAWAIEARRASEGSASIVPRLRVGLQCGHE